LIVGSDKKPLNPVSMSAVKGCLESGNGPLTFQIGPEEPNQLITEYWYVDRYRTLRPYQEEKH